MFGGGIEDKKALVTTNWNDLVAPIELGGLGFGNTTIRNLGLLSKWWLKFCSVDNALWKIIVGSTNFRSTSSNFCSQTHVPNGPWMTIPEECTMIP